MMRIIALNEDLNENSDDNVEVTVTREAQETIAISEYMRALKYKGEGKIDDALFLFSELLETQVLVDVTVERKDDKLFSVKYSCYRNVGFIHEEKGEFVKAVESLIKAMELDDTDVYTMSRLGQLAVKIKQIDIAHTAFGKCLQRNPNHWPSIDGILQVYCLSENILEAYGWALKWYKVDENYERAYDVLVEISEKFEFNLPFFEQLFGDSFRYDKSIIRDETKSNFPGYCLDEPNEDYAPLNIDYKDYKIDKLNWQTLGTLIVKLYKHLEDNNNNLCTLFSLNDFLGVDEPKTDLSDFTPIGDVKDGDRTPKTASGDESSNNQTNSRRESVDETGGESPSENEFVPPTSDNILSANNDLNTTDDNGNKTDDGNNSEPTPKTKVRRNELSILEQWGWHKTRRATRKKCSQLEVVENSVDTSVNGFLRRVLSPYFLENYADSQQNPFIDDIGTNSNDETMPDVQKSIGNTGTDTVTVDMFQESSENDFKVLIDDLKVTKFDLIIIINKWLETTSKYWVQKMPKELTQLYIQIYELYMCHMDLQSWSIMEFSEFSVTFHMMLFYLELEYQRMIDEYVKEIPNEYRMKMLHLTAFSGFSFNIDEDDYFTTITRLVWINYNIALFDNDLNQALDCLIQIEDYIISYNSEFSVFLPNRKQNNSFNLEFVIDMKQRLRRKLSLKDVRKFYDQQKFAELEVILKESVVHVSEQKQFDEPPLKIQIQIEVLLESLWRQEKDEECLVWCEKCLKYALDNYFKSPNDTYRQTEWADSVTFILAYIENLLVDNTIYILRCLSMKQLSRLIQNLTKIVVNQLDTPFDKNNNTVHPINLRIPWIILYYIMQGEDDRNYVKTKISEASSSQSSPMQNGDAEENIPNSFALLFTAHDYMGRKLWCSKENGKFLLFILEVVAPQIRSPTLESMRELVMEYVEQVTYCLYGYPQKRARLRHIEEHDAQNIELTWNRAIQLFDIYRPENLPEFNAYKTESITSEMEQQLNKILQILPPQYDLTEQSKEIYGFLSGKRADLPGEINILPPRISCIYFLMADFYFKTREFSKTIKYYILDLTMNPKRFDSWAGLALSKATNLETKLNSCEPLNSNDVFTQSEETLKCFEQCITFNRKQTLVWIEYGTFAYSIHAFCSRNLKQNSDTLSMEKFAFVEEKKEECINIAYTCFDTINREPTFEVDPEESQHDERWLYHYMLGKISEKKKEHPSVYLTHYTQSAKFLYENNATYPIKINHSSPQNLSIEALEIFYRISASIIKYIEQHSVVQRDIGKLFNRILKEMSTSPFAMNQAKIDDSSINALKRKLNPNNDENTEIKIIKLDNQSTIVESTSKIPKVVPPPVTTPEEDKVMSDGGEKMIIETSSPPPTPIGGGGDVQNADVKPTSPNRRGSQESNVTTTTTTSTGNSSSTSSSSSSESSDDSSSDDSDSDSTSDDESSSKKNLGDDVPFTESELEHIYKCCMKNFEECVIRFPEHYKSIYRLVYFYMNGPVKSRDFEKCKQLFLSNYKTSLGSMVQGLFFERKTNNFFNGIWRIPSPEIDRPGSFSSHLSKCVIILMEILKKSYDYNLLLDLAIQLHRKPEHDKRYLKDSERKDLHQQAISFTVQTFRLLYKKYNSDHNHAELLNLVIEIHKSNRRCIKHMQLKEGAFNAVLSETYRAVVKDKMKLPDSVNLVCDMAIRFCNHENNQRKNAEKQGIVMSQGTVLSNFIETFGGNYKITNTTTTSDAGSAVAAAFTQFSTAPTKVATADLVPIKSTSNFSSSGVNTTIGNSISITPVSSTGISLVTTSAVSSTSVTSVTSVSNSNSNRQKNRNSGNKSNSSNATNLMNMSAYNDPAMMAMLLSSMPHLMGGMAMSDSTMMSSLADYYSKLGASGFGGLSNLSPLLGGSVSMNLVPPLQQPSIQTTAGSNVSAATKVTSINNQLTITTAPSFSKDTTNASKSNQQPSKLQSTSKDKTPSLPSVLKKDLLTSSFSAKILQEMTAGISSSMLSSGGGSNASAAKSSSQQFSQQNLKILQDLPKSLTITPSNVGMVDKKSASPMVMGGRAASQAQNEMAQRQKFTADKVRNQKKQNVGGGGQQQQQPYRKQAYSQAKDNMASKLNYDMSEYNRQLKLLSTYAEVLNMNSGMNKKQQGQQTAAGSSAQFSKQQKNANKMMSMAAAASGSSISPHHHGSSKTPPISIGGTGGHLLKNQSPILINSPTKSPIMGTNLSRQSMTPPATSVMPPQTKTLQQKLAEQKQKANASMINSNNNNNSGSNKAGTNPNRKRPPNSSPEVIILE